MQPTATHSVPRSRHALDGLHRRLATGAAVAVALGFAYHAVIGHNGITAYAQKRSEDRALTQQIRTLQSENARLRTHVEHLQNDPDAIEHEAREQLHYARRGEVIYTLEDAPATRSAPQSPAPSAKPTARR
ncbi:MAG TPA: septum formation initiator family protein [Acidobacteriaceae bacterium]